MAPPAGRAATAREDPQEPARRAPAARRRGHRAHDGDPLGGQRDARRGPPGRAGRQPGRSARRRLPSSRASPGSAASSSPSRASATPRELSAAAARAGTEIGVLVELDVGLHRSGRALASRPPWRSARSSTDCPGSACAGSSATRATACSSPTGRCASEGPGGERRAARAVDAFDAHGLATAVVAAGGLGTWDITGANPRITEIHAGSYVFSDAFHRNLVPGFEPALTVLATVIARHGDVAIADCGRKSIGIDRTPPEVLDGQGSVRFEHGEHFVHEEHTAIDLAPGSTVGVGDRIELMPGYAPTTVNHYDLYYVVADDRIVDVWPILARYGYRHRRRRPRRRLTRNAPDDSSQVHEERRHTQWPDHRAVVQHRLPARREPHLRGRHVAERPQGRHRLDATALPERRVLRRGLPHGSRRSGAPSRATSAPARPRGRAAEGDYDDPTAVLTGEWGRTSTGRATSSAGTRPSEYFQEVQIRLRHTMRPNWCSGYEVFCRCLKTEDRLRGDRPLERQDRRLDFAADATPARVRRRGRRPHRGHHRRQCHHGLHQRRGDDHGHGRH